MKYRLSYFDRKDAAILIRKGYALYGEYFYGYLKKALDVLSPISWYDFKDRIEAEIKKEREGNK